MKNKKKKNEETLIFDIVSVNKKGQIVIPAKIRKKMDIKENSRFLVVNSRKESLILIKAEDFSSRMKELEKMSKKIKIT